MKVKRPKNPSEISLNGQRTTQTSILVAGGAGFIGSQLCKVLLENCQVFCLASPKDYTSVTAKSNLVKGKRENIEPFFEKENFVFIEHDLKRKLPTDLPRVDYIFHLAGISAYLDDETMRLETLLVNSLGTQHLLEFAHKCQAKFLLVSSFRVYEGAISKEALKNYFGKSRLAETRFSHREAKRFSENLCFEYFKKEDLDTRIVRLADVYGPAMPLDSEEELSLIFKSLVEKEPLKIKGSGEEVLYPTFISDIIRGLLKAMFTASSKGKIFTLINPKKLTVNEAVHKIEELVGKAKGERKVRIEFVPQEIKSSPQTPEGTILKSQEELGWQPKVDFEEGVGETLEWFKTPLDKKVEPEKDLKKKKADGRDYLATGGVIPKFKLPSFSFLFGKIGKNLSSLNSAFKKNWFFITLSSFFLLVIISPFLFFSGHTFFGLVKLKNAYNNLQKGEISSVYARAWQAEYHFKTAKNTLLQFSFLLKPISNKGVERANELLGLGENLSGILKRGSQVVEKQQELLNLVLQKESGQPSEVLADLKISLAETLEKLALVQAQLDSELKPLLSLKTFSLGERLTKIAEELPERKSELERLRELTRLLPELLGFSRKKTYLLVFQNNMELRPTGGFIGSYGLLIFDKGKLLDFEVQDIYVADGQLKGHVEPPEELKKHLGEANWHFRDANWDPDWIRTAPRLEWFLEKTMKRQVEGVVGLNLTVAQEILKVIGQVNLPDYQETVTSDNLFERAEYYSEIDFFPGSTQKKDFLGELNRQMMTSIKELEDKNFLKLGKAFTRALQEKQLLLYFRQEDLANFVRGHSWDGAIRKIDYGQQDKGLQNYLMLVEANVGVNKTNYFLSREVTHKLKLDKELKTQAETLISYTNMSPGESWPGGIYKNYLRAYLPKTAGKVEVMFKKEGREEFVPLASSKIKEEVVGDKKVIGFYFEVPVKEKLEVKLTYSLGELRIKGNQGILAFYFQKQSGIVEDPLSFEIDYPAYLQVLKTEPEIKVSPQNLLFETDQREDRLFTVYFFKR